MQGLGLPPKGVLPWGSGSPTHGPTSCAPSIESGAPMWEKGSVAAGSTIHRVLPGEGIHVRPRSHIPVLQATGRSLARLHRGPWQTSPGAMEATGDRRAGTQSRRGSPAKQSEPATAATRVRRSYRRLAGAIPLVVRDTPHGWAAPRAAAQRRGQLALPMDTCGDTLPPGTHGPGGRDNAFPSTWGSGSRGT